ncbi:MAG TPA: carboxyl transferase domain-containing protein [Streptosporangiaceae bacterium]
MLDHRVADAERLATDPEDRLAALFDAGSFRPFAVGAAGTVLSGGGRVDGRPAVAFATDPRVGGGAIGRTGCAAILHAYDQALRQRVPVIGLWHSGGARLQEGVESLDAIGGVFAAMTRASGVVPQISAVLGPAGGGAAYGPALTDVVIIASAGRMFVTGPAVVRGVTGEDVDMAALGGPEPHSRRSGVAHLVAADEAAALRLARRAAVLLGDRDQVRLAAVAETDLLGLLPADSRRAYPVQPLVNGLLDEPGLELHAKWAPNIVTTLGRLGGGTVGVLANNPLRLGGCLDAAAADKAARFVRMCDSFGISLVVVVDVPGYLPGVRQEHDGVVRRGAKLLHAFAEAVVPRVTLVTRKAYGGAYIAMNSRAIGATKVFAWPTAEVGVMGPVAAVRILHRRRLAATSQDRRDDVERELVAAYEKEAGGLQRAREVGSVDAVIDPAATRGTIAGALVEATQARGWHGNIPL